MPNGRIRTLGILDDSNDSRDVLRYFLESEGFEIREFGCKRDFVEHVEQAQLDLALVDLWLPDGSGLDLPSEVKRRAGKEFPFIAVTANAQSAVFQEAAQAGFCEVVVKPVDFGRLLSTVLRHLR